MVKIKLLDIVGFLDVDIFIEIHKNFFGKFFALKNDDLK
jgi:hypothetical protein